MIWGIHEFLCIQYFFYVWAVKCIRNWSGVFRDGLVFDDWFYGHIFMNSLGIKRCECVSNSAISRSDLVYLSGFYVFSKDWYVVLNSCLVRSWY